MFLKKELLFDAVGVALERKRAVFEVRQDQAGDRGVVVEDIALGIAVVRVIDLL